MHWGGVSTKEDAAFKFAVIGTPVAHSLSPVMHNAVYSANKLNWTYAAVDCPDEAAAKHMIDLVRTGAYKGLNVTMPYKQLALAQADVVDPAALAAGGANVLVRKGSELHAFNTDGYGAAGAVAHQGHMNPHGRYVAVCGTGPTSVAIVCAFASLNAREVVLLSRKREKAQETVERLASVLDPRAAKCLKAADYSLCWQLIPTRDIVVDATPRGMNAGDEPVIDPLLFHKGQVVMDVVYNHGVTKLLAGAREQGALAMDGLEMLVEQAALSIEIWAEALGYELKVSRDLMRGPLPTTSKQPEYLVDGQETEQQDAS